MTAHQFVITQSAEREAFGNYRYSVWTDHKIIVEIEHTYRGDEYWMRLPGQDWIATDRSLDGGGQEPLRLSNSGMSDLKRLTKP